MHGSATAMRYGVLCRQGDIEYIISYRCSSSRSIPNPGFIILLLQYKFSIP